MLAMNKVQQVLALENYNMTQQKKSPISIGKEKISTSVDIGEVQ